MGATESNEPDDAQSEAELRSLDPGARDVLVALAVCGRASLSVEEFAEITGLSEVRLALRELERRGLVVRDGDRFSLAPPERGPLKRLLGGISPAGSLFGPISWQSHSSNLPPRPFRNRGWVGPVSKKVAR